MIMHSVVEMKDRYCLILIIARAESVKQLHNMDWEVIKSSIFHDQLQRLSINPKIFGFAAFLHEQQHCSRQHPFRQLETDGF